MFKIYYDKINPYFDEDVFRKAYSQARDVRKEKIDSLGSVEAKARSLAAEILLIKGTEDMGISHLLDTISVGEHGKPDFTKASGWHYNLSHSGEYVMLGIADSAIGVDIQEIKGIKSGLADRFFHTDEKEYLDRIKRSNAKGIDSDEYLQAFFRIWCLKESYVKYTGMGLGQGLDTFTVLGRLADSKLLGDDRYVSALWV